MIDKNDIREAIARIIDEDAFDVPDYAETNNWAHRRNRAREIADHVLRVIDEYAKKTLLDYNVRTYT
jgi:hypothetical protein